MTFWDNDITTDQRSYVMELQSYLRALERDRTGTTTVPQDGFFGDDTAAGVRHFQQQAGLPVTGQVDRVTWETLFAAYSEQNRKQAPPLSIIGLRQPELQPGDQGDSVLFLNTMLGLSEPTYTPATVQAIKKFQAAALLPVTGITDKPTWDAVTRLYNQGGVR